MDCKVHVLVDFLTYKILGYNEKDEMYSKMIREGRIDRNTTLQKLDALRVTGNDAGKIMDFLDEYDLDHNEIKNMIGV